MTTAGSRRIRVLVGTDHHDFSRVVSWADAWQREHPDDDVLVQHGFSPAPERARGVELVPPSELVPLLARADVVVTHGGPGTIMSARHAGHRPVAVARDPDRGEHVDGHQMRFVTWAAAKGLCARAQSTEELSRTVLALGPTGTRSTAGGDVGLTVDDRWFDETVTRRRGRRDPSPTAIRVLYCADRSWTPAARPVSAGSVALLTVGNLSRLWLEGAEARCSCGSPLRGCEFWGAVVEDALDGWGAVELETARTLQLQLRGHGLSASRRHPGIRLRRKLLGLANIYRTVARAALEVSGADAVVDHGGPLIDALLLSHCREIDLRVLRPVSWSGSDEAALAALRYRGVPLVRSAGVPKPIEEDDQMSLHQLALPGPRVTHGSITE